MFTFATAASASDHGGALLVVAVREPVRKA
jgi:hypothetical protein